MIHFIGDREYLLLFHLTPRRNGDVIASTGIKVKRSKGAMECIWFCEESKVQWARQHLAVHHGVTEENLVAFKALLPKWCVTNRGRGCYITWNDIPAWLLATHKL